MIVQTRKKIAEGNTLYRSQQTFKSIYAIKKGFFKSSMVTIDGKEQVTGFFMSGDIIGLDGISNNYHRLNSTAIEDSEVCVIPFDILERFSEKHPALLRQLHKIMSQRMINDQETMLLLGSMKADKKIATFLINLSDQLARRGQHANLFQLRMKREEIGSYLGLTLETVSRVLSKLQRKNLIKIQQKHVEIINDKELRELS
jgi:CRP/FNR family transcriptional regulator